MKKKWLALAMSVVMCAGVFAACGGGGSNDTGNDTADSPAAAETTQEAADVPQEEEGDDSADADSAPASQSNGKYALVISHMTNAFVTTFAENAQLKADELGVELTIFDGNKDSATQISQIESAITQGYAGIMVEPVSVDGIKPAVVAANEAGIPVITVIQKMAEQDLAKSYVGGNDKEAGKLEMEKAIEAIGGKGSIAILYGPMGSDAQLIRKEGYDEVLAQYPDVTVEFEQTANWVTDEALKIAENWLQSGKEISAIVAQNDGMAVGAMKAVQDAQMGDKIKIYGIDATPDGLDAIASGRMDGTVSQSVAMMGQQSTETLHKVVNGESVESEVLMTPEWVTIDNIADYQ